MKNEPVAWMDGEGGFYHNDDYEVCKEHNIADDLIPLYTHPVKELHLSLQKSKQTGELLAVTYTDDEHRIVEVLWQRPPVKELTDEDRSMLIRTLKWSEDLLREAGHGGAVSDVQDCLMILRKAQEK